MNDDDIRKEIRRLEERGKELRDLALEEAKRPTYDEFTLNLPHVQLPQDNHRISDFAKDIANYFIGCEEIFYKPDEDKIIEVKEYRDAILKRNIVGFKSVDAKRLLNIIESKVMTFKKVLSNSVDIHIDKSPTEQVVRLLSANSSFVSCLHQIKRLLNYPLPMMDSEGYLIIPKIGYDKRYQAYITPDTPNLEYLDIGDAKKIILDILSEFCFKDKIDISIAISYILTPMCRGLYHRPTARTPLFIIMANRERAGKDYLAGVVGILFEGRAIDDNPIVSGDKSQNNNEELRKRLTSSLKQGRRRIHSSNNKGHLNNAILEQFLTSEVWIDRELGHNKTIELNNEVDVSLSANIGLTYTPDIWHRARPINLFYAEENPNDRIFKNPDLWGYVKKHRAEILSAIFTLQKSWFDAGSPSGLTPFTSFPEWARVVGGIMTYHGLGNPCQEIADEIVGGDRETRVMKEIYRLMAEYSHTSGQQGFTIAEIRQLIMSAQGNDDLEEIPGIDLTQKSGQTRFGFLIKRYIGREFLCIISGVTVKVKLLVILLDSRSARIKYGFKINNVGNLGDVSPPLNYAQESKHIIDITKVSNVTPLPCPNLGLEDIKCMLLDRSMTKNLLLSKGFKEDQLSDWLIEGVIYEYKAETYKLGGI